MPIALLLVEIQKRRREWIPMFADWSRLLSTEEALWQRARGAFLRHWFGPGLAMEGPALVVNLSNVAALRSQYLFATSNQDDGMNLMEPLAGMAGGLVGGLVGVIGGFFLPWAPVVVPVILAIVGGLIGIAGGVIAAVYSSDPETQAIFLFTSSIARLIEQFLTFWDWFSGPPAKIVNPILRLLRTTADRLPAVTIHLTAFVAIFFTRILPWAAQFIAILPAYYALVMSVVDYLKSVWDDLMAHLSDLFTGPRSPLATVHRAADILGQIGDVAKAGMKKIVRAMTSGIARVATVVEGLATQWFAEVQLGITAMLDGSSAVSLVRNASDIFDAVTSVLKAHFPTITSMLSGSDSNPKKPPSDPGLLDRTRAETEAILGPPPTPGLWDEWWRMRDQGFMPDMDAFFNRGQLVVNQSGELSTIFSMGSDLNRQIRDDLNKPLPNAFAGERRALRTREHGDPAAQLLNLHTEELKYRNLLGSIVDRLLGASASGSFAALESSLDRIDTELHLPANRNKRAALPLLDVRDENLIRLEVPKFRIRFRGPADDDTKSEVTSFGDELRSMWVGQEYRMIPA